jgi:hypothetical protein
MNYHPNAQIKEISKYLVEKTGKEGKVRVRLCRLFSVSEEERNVAAKELFKGNGSSIAKQIQEESLPKAASSKKQLKIGVETIENYIKILFNPHLE